MMKHKKRIVWAVLLVLCLFLTSCSTGLQKPESFVPIENKTNNGRQTEEQPVTAPVASGRESPATEPAAPSTETPQITDSAPVETGLIAVLTDAVTETEEAPVEPTQEAETEPDVSEPEPVIPESEAPVETEPAASESAQTKVNTGDFEKPDDTKQSSQIGESSEDANKSSENSTGAGDTKKSSKSGTGSGGTKKSSESGSKSGGKKSTSSDDSKEKPDSYDYVLNTHTKKYHKPDCSSVNIIKDENRDYYSGSAKELKKQGYEPCGNCIGKASGGSGDSSKGDSGKGTGDQNKNKSSESKTAKNYVANTNTKKFHLPSCGSVKTIKEENRWDYTGDREELLAQGYEPCKRCNP